MHACLGDMIEVIPDTKTPAWSVETLGRECNQSSWRNMSVLYHLGLHYMADHGTIGPRKLESKTVKRSKVSKKKRKESLKEDRHRKEKQKGRK